MGYRGNAKHNGNYAISYFDRDFVNEINKECGTCYSIKEIKEIARRIEPTYYDYAGINNKKTKIFKKNTICDYIKKIYERK